jgi:hypothetical protein
MEQGGDPTLHQAFTGLHNQYNQQIQALNNRVAQSERQRQEDLETAQTAQQLQTETEYAFRQFPKTYGNERTQNMLKRAVVGQMHAYGVENLNVLQIAKELHDILEDDRKATLKNVRQDVTSPKGPIAVKGSPSTPKKKGSGSTAADHDTAFRNWFEGQKEANEG